MRDDDDWTLYLALSVGGLAELVEGHDDDGGAEAAHQRRLADELLLALLERNRVDDALALAALEAGLDHRKVGRVDAQRHLREADLAFGKR